MSHLQSKIFKIIKKLKNFVHRHETLEKSLLFIWGIFWIFRAKFIFRKIKHNPVKRSFKAIILGVRTIPTTNLVYFDAIFGHAFEKLGCQVRMLYCDGLLDSCDADTVFRSQRPQCFVCKKLGGLVKDALNLDCISYCQYISESDIKEIKEKAKKLDEKDLLNYKYLGVDVGRHARASAIRHFLFGKLDLSNPAHIDFLRKKLVYAMISTKIAEGLVAKEKPDVIFMLHGIYSTWGTFLHYFRSKGIETIIYTEMLLRIGYFIFNRNSEQHRLVSEKIWSDFRRLPLRKEEETMVDDYFTKRFKGDMGDQKIYEKHFDNKIKKQVLLEFLSKKKYTRRYVIYPNLAWDGLVEGPKSKIFNNIFSWLDATIEFFKTNKDYQFIIKPPPTERVFERCSKDIADYIIEKHGPLPENIIVLKPDVPLRTHDLVDHNTIGIVFNGTCGLELAVTGIPVLVVADVHYREAGVVYNIKTLEEYLGLLEDPQKLISFAKNNIKLIKKYAYFYLFKTMIKIPFYKKDKFAEIDWKIVKNNEKLLGDNSNIIKICRRIINKEDVAEPL
ncbi:MAG: hypothetical protein ABIG40_01605 [Parcubacteria group bacterium]